MKDELTFKDRMWLNTYRVASSNWKHESNRDWKITGMIVVCLLINYEFLYSLGVFN